MIRRAWRAFTTSEYARGTWRGLRVALFRVLACLVIAAFKQPGRGGTLRKLGKPLVRHWLRNRRRRRVLFVGQAYYNAWYLSRELRHYGWQADLLNWCFDEPTQIYFHGEDVRFFGTDAVALRDQLAYYIHALWYYDIFHFSNAHAISFGDIIHYWVAPRFGAYAEIEILRTLDKKVAYSNNGCYDGVSQTSFSKWGSEPVCNICRWQNEPKVCSDERNLAWGAFRNRIADFQCLSGGNHADYNLAPTVHEVPQFYCLDSDVWRPDLEIPERFRLALPADSVKLFHSVGNLAIRTNEAGVNIKSTHVYLPLIAKLKAEGLPIELVSFTDVPNKDIRYYQAQSDIFLDMLSFGWFGATGREALMLGKVVVCYLRPEWAESVRAELPGYVEQLPVVSATPDTIEPILRRLIASSEERREIGHRAREFALRWHSSTVAAALFDRIYAQLLEQPTASGAGRS